MSKKRMAVLAVVAVVLAIAVAVAAWQIWLHGPGGQPVFEGLCEMTLIGGDLDIVLDSLDDPMRTATDSANEAGCGFNLPVVSLRLTIGDYVETFNFDPPRTSIPFPLNGDVPSVQTGEPLAPGLYPRRLVAVAEGGQEWEIGPGRWQEFLDTVTLEGPK